MSKTALILCGGYGTRFRSISNGPKILAEFNKSSYIDWLYCYLLDHGFDKVVLCLGYKSTEIIDYINDKNMIIQTEVIIESETMGTGGAIVNAMIALNLQDVFVFNGDTFWDTNIPNELFTATDAQCLMCVTEIEVNDRFGDVAVDDCGNATIKHGTTNTPIYNSHVYTGILRLRANLITHSLKLPYSLEDLIQTDLMEVRTIPYKSNFIDYGTPEGFWDLKAKNEL